MLLTLLLQLLLLLRALLLNLLLTLLLQLLLLRPLLLDLLLTLLLQLLLLRPLLLYLLLTLLLKLQLLLALLLLKLQLLGPLLLDLLLALLLQLLLLRPLLQDRLLALLLRRQRRAGRRLTGHRRGQPRTSRRREALHGRDGRGALTAHGAGERVERGTACAGQRLPAQGAGQSLTASRARQSRSRPRRRGEALQWRFGERRRLTAGQHLQSTVRDRRQGALRAAHLTEIRLNVLTLRPHRPQRLHDGRGGDGGDRHGAKSRQIAIARRRGRRRQFVERGAARRQEIIRRRRGRREIEATVEDHGRAALDENDFLGRRRRQIVIGVEIELRRWLKRGAQEFETATRVPRVRPMRIAPQIGPIGVRRVGEIGGAPRARLAPRRQHGAHALGVNRIGIGVQIILITADGIALEHHRIGFVGGEVADRLAADIGRLLDRQSGRGARGRLEEDDALVELRGVPGDHRAFRQFVDAQAGAHEDFFDRHAAFMHQFDESARIGAVGRRLVGRDGSGRGVIGDERSAIGLDEFETAGDLSAGHEWRRARGVEHDDARLELRLGESPGQIGHARALGGDIRRSAELSADRQKIVLAGELRGAARQIDEGDAALPLRADLGGEILHRRAQGRRVEIGRARHVEAGLPQRFGDKARVVGGRRLRRAGVFDIAEHQGQPRLRRLRHGGRRQAQAEGERPKDVAKKSHKHRLR